MASNEETKQNNTIQGNPSTKTDSKKKPPYEKSYLRVSKDTLYMIIALWIEDFVDEAPEEHNKVGAVLVLPNDVILAADCSRDEGHAVARLLIKHSGKAEGCKMFVSRKPCPFCAKLLVQSKVKRVLFLPIREPEYYRSPEASTKADQSAQSPNDKPETDKKDDNDEKMKAVETMFTASAIAQTKFVLRIEEPVGERARESTPEEKKQVVEERKAKLMQKYRPEESWDTVAIKTKLPWPAFDQKIQAEVQSNFENVMEWIARVLVVQGRGLDYKFILRNEKSKKSKKGFNPLRHPDVEKAKYFIEIARFLTQRTDDPTTGVGAVIVSQDMEVLSFGWNGYPFGAQYGEFARASGKDNKSLEKKNANEKIDEKYPYVIHAEQNALLVRNSKNLEGAILFVTRCPCDECAPLIAMTGIQTVVVEDDIEARGKESGYKRFPKMVAEGTFVCFETQRKQVGEKGIPASEERSKKIDLETKRDHLEQDTLAS